MTSPQCSYAVHLTSLEQRMSLPNVGREPLILKLNGLLPNSARVRPQSDCLCGSPKSGTDDCADN